MERKKAPSKSSKGPRMGGAMAPKKGAKGSRVGKSVKSAKLDRLVRAEQRSKSDTKMPGGKAAPAGPKRMARMAKEPMAKKGRKRGSNRDYR